MEFVYYIVIGFFSAIGWKGADYMFEKIGQEPTSVTQTIEKKDEKKDSAVCKSPPMLDSISQRGNECIK